MHREVREGPQSPLATIQVGKSSRAARRLSILWSMQLTGNSSTGAPSPQGDLLIAVGVGSGGHLGHDMQRRRKGLRSALVLAGTVCTRLQQCNTTEISAHDMEPTAKARYQVSVGYVIRHAMTAATSLIDTGCCKRLARPHRLNDAKGSYISNEDQADMTFCHRAQILCKYEQCGQRSLSKYAHKRLLSLGLARYGPAVSPERSQHPPLPQRDP